MSHPLGDSEELVRTIKLIIESFNNYVLRDEMLRYRYNYSEIVYLTENKSIKSIHIGRSNFAVYGKKKKGVSYFFYWNGVTSDRNPEVIRSHVYNLFYRKSQKKDMEIFMHTLNELSFKYV